MALGRFEQVPCRPPDPPPRLIDDYYSAHPFALQLVSTLAIDPMSGLPVLASLSTEQQVATGIYHHPTFSNFLLFTGLAKDRHHLAIYCEATGQRLAPREFPVHMQSPDNSEILMVCHTAAAELERNGWKKIK